MTTVDAKRYKELADEVDAALSQMITEYNFGLLKLKNEPEAIRIRLLLAFSLLEVVCNIYNCYFNKNLGNRELLKTWLAEYCLTNVNATYAAHPYLKMMTAEYMYKFRNAIIHAFALPEPEHGISITIPNGTESADVIKRADEKFRSGGHKLIFISADELTKLFIDGYRLMSPQIFKNGLYATPAEFTAMRKLAKEFARRGAKPIALNVF